MRLVNLAEILVSLLLTGSLAQAQQTGTNIESSNPSLRIEARTVVIDGCDR